MGREAGRLRAGLMLAAAALALAGCDKLKSDDAGCSAATSQSTVVKIITGDITRASRSEGRDTTGYSAAEFRAALGQVVITLADIRTDRKDPDSTKQFCTATMKIVFPDKIVTDADDVRADVQLSSVADMAEDAGLEPAANAFTTEVSYSVQPTDDGSKLFAEISGRMPSTVFVKEVLASALLHGELAARQTASVQQSAQIAIDNAARDAQALSAARSDTAAADGQVNALWRDMPAYDRNELLPSQRRWIARKARECRAEGLASGNDAGQQELVRLACEARMSRVRVEELLRGGIAAEE